jgi:hypothetical protein
VQRHQQEGFLVAAEYKRMKEASRGQGYLEAKGPRPEDAGCHAFEEEDEDEEEHTRKSLY